MMVDISRMDEYSLAKVLNIVKDLKERSDDIEQKAEEEYGLFCLASYTTQTKWCDTQVMKMARYFVFGNVRWGCDCCGEGRMEQRSDRAFMASFER